jgi:hypothetical protein
MPALGLGFQANYGGLDRGEAVRNNMIYKSQPRGFGENICGTYSFSSREGIGMRSLSTAMGKMNFM